jgi:hypothetical protein
MLAAATAAGAILGLEASDKTIPVVTGNAKTKDDRTTVKINNL